MMEAKKTEDVNILKQTKTVTRGISQKLDKDAIAATADSLEKKTLTLTPTHMAVNAGKKRYKSSEGP